MPLHNISKNMIRKFQIDPFLFMGLLGMTEFFKHNQIGKLADSKTVNGYQPKLEKPIEWPGFEPLNKEISSIIDKNIKEKWKFSRSWIISYNKGGWQNKHIHEYSNISGVLVMFGMGEGKLHFDTGQVFSMHTGDLLLFDSNIEHWADPCVYPKTLLSFDVRTFE